MQHGGDDLDDDFVPDDLVALSDEELPETDDVGELLSADEGEGGGAQLSQSHSAAALDRKRKRRAKEKERKAKVRTVYQLLLNVRYDCRCRNKS